MSDNAVHFAAPAIAEGDGGSDEEAGRWRTLEGCFNIRQPDLAGMAHGTFRERVSGLYPTLSLVFTP